jgi:tRNA(Ile)-lysidine synthase
VSSGLTQQISHFCHKNHLLSHNDKVVIGVSGGPDSVCLLHLLANLRVELNLNLTVAHLNHQLRGPDSQADAEFVQALSAQWQIPCLVETHNIAHLATERKQSIEEAARHVRYAFLWRVADQVGAAKIAVGHNADDQVETILMHFLRGAGLSGLRGMLPAMDIAQLRLYMADLPAPTSEPPPQLIRPLLNTPRRDIEAYCQEHHLLPRFDHSNLDTTFFRNRLRHELIPLLETYNPNLRQVLRRMAQVVTAEVDYLNSQLELVWATIVQSESTEKIVIDRAAWLKLPPALQRSTLRRAVQTLRRSLRDINFEHIDPAVAILQAGQVGARATLPGGLWVNLGYDTFVIIPKNTSAFAWPDDWPQLAAELELKVQLPGITLLPYSNWQLTAAFLQPHHPHLLPQLSTGRWEAFLDADVVGPNPILRTRRPGDKFAPLGLAGRRQKVNEFMINQKIPASWRPYLPLLTAGNQVLWVCGFRPDQQASLGPNTRRVLHLKFELFTSLKNQL